MKIKELTVVILTDNKGEKFQKAIESIKFANEVLVIENKDPITNFSQVRNEALKTVKTEWVLFLDSDETLSENSALEIKKIIENNMFDAVTIPRTDYFLGKHLNYGEVGSTTLIRMFKTKNGKFSRNVHEIVEYQGKLGSANFSIYHYSHDSIKEFFEKISKYSLMDSKNKTLGKNETIIEMLIYPPIKFVVNYVFRFGFLDGFRGLIYAILMSFHSFFVRVFHYENL